MTDDPVEKTTEFLKDWTRVLQCSDDANIDWPVVMLLNCCYGANAWVSRNLEEDGFKSLPGKVMVCLTAYDPC